MGTVYFINGFLEAGKTTFIKELFSKESFRIPGKTLIIMCEEGNQVFSDSELAQANAVLEVLEERKEFTVDNLLRLEDKHHPERIIVEYNGMWDRKSIVFPQSWGNIMEIAVFDSVTFKLYSENLRAYVTEQVRKAELVVFYRADVVRDKLGGFLRNIKAVNTGAALVFLGAEGDIILDPDEALPFDISSDELDLDDVGFAVMCMDSMERVEVYEDKKVHFMARVYKMKDGGEFEFVAGRWVMTCCEADMTFLGIICAHPKAYELQNKDWVEITGVIRIVYDEVMKRDTPVCKVVDLKMAEKPEQEFVSMI
ncbi:MAG: GTPase [Lachnospiraceae bacterium]|nr:GTPase [Lachnospiraceae bacterium]